MLTLRTNATTLYVNRSTQQWIVRDGDGNLWTVPTGKERPWDRRQPFTPAEDTELELVPGHYKSMLGLPT